LNGALSASQSSCFEITPQSYQELARHGHDGDAARPALEAADPTALAMQTPGVFLFDARNTHHAEGLRITLTFKADGLRLAIALSIS
jgi:hypothetical protein